MSSAFTQLYNEEKHEGFISKVRKAWVYKTSFLLDVAEEYGANLIDVGRAKHGMTFLDLGMDATEVAIHFVNGDNYSAGTAAFNLSLSGAAAGTLYILGASASAGIITGLVLTSATNALWNHTKN